LVPVRRLLFVLMLLLASTPAMAHASSMTLSSAQQVYLYGENIRIVANVTNDADTPAKVYIEHTLRDLMGRVATGYLLKVVDVGAHEAKLVELYDVKVDDSFYSGQYIVWASLIVNKVRVGEEELSFTVEGAPEDMEVRLQISSDPDYASVGHVFMMGEKAYMQLVGAPQGATVSTLLKLPDNSTQQLALPVALTVKQAGRYSVYVNVSATGYRDIHLRDFISVTENGPDALADRKETSSISLQLDETSYTVGEEAVATGEISPPHAGASVTLTFSRGGASEATIIATTDDDGHYQAKYEAQADGQWSVKAEWGGDSNHEAAASQQLSFTVEAQPMNWLPLAMAAAAIVVVAALVLFLRKKR
jgi:hypothetical protein